MRTNFFVLFVAAATLCAQPAAVAQRHNAGSSPPTAPPAAHSSGAQPIVAASSGLGALQFAAVKTKQVLYTPEEIALLKASAAKENKLPKPLRTAPLSAEERARWTARLEELLRVIRDLTERSAV